jgi:hypothetical protein
VHLVGFTIEIYYNAQSYKRQIKQIKIMISELNFIIINTKVNDNYFNAGIIKLAVLLNFRDIWTYKNSNDFNTTQNSCRNNNAARCSYIKKKILMEHNNHLKH